MGKKKSEKGVNGGIHQEKTKKSATHGSQTHENSHNIASTDNRVDNRVDNKHINETKQEAESIHNNYHYVNHGVGTETEPQAEEQPHWKVSFPRNEDFIGDSQTFNWLNEKLNKLKDGELAHHKVALWGIGGAGYVLVLIPWGPRRRLHRLI